MTRRGPSLMWGLGAGLVLAAAALGAGRAEGPTARVVRLRTVPNRMAFDRPRVYVEAGGPVELVVENRDIMPHNLVLGEPGSLVELGRSAERMAAEPDALARSFVPASPRVLHATRLIQPGEQERLAFRAPDALGDYPFACTLPGHWRNMNGVMVVVRRLADVPPEALRAVPEPEGGVRRFVHAWVRDELAGELGGLDRGRSLARGRALFAAAGCVRCHRVRGVGGDFGPDLGTVPARLAAGTLTRDELLREVLEPSRVIEPGYRPLVIETRDGAVVAGLVVARDDQSIRLRPGPDAAPRTIAVRSVADLAESNVSLMPEGLLVTFSKEEILDLLAYVISGGDPAFAGYAP